MFSKRIVVPLLCFLPAPLLGGSTPSSVQLGTSPNASIFGQPVTLTATVTPATATGKVTFYDGTTFLDSVPLTNGTAKLITVRLAALKRSLTAYYSGDSTYAASTSTPVLQTVNAVASGSFQAASNYGAGTDPTFVATGDFNGDGKLDLVTANNQANLPMGAVNVLIGNGNGSFKTAVPYSVGGNPIFVGAVDLNGDGNADLVVVNGQGYVSVLLGSASGAFSPAVQYPVNSPADPFVFSAAIADFNGDGKADVVVSRGDGSVAVLLGGGDGTFGSPMVTANAAGYPEALAVGDFNADGKADIAVTDTVNSNVNVLFGNGHGLFAPPVSYPVGTYPLGIVVGDFDGSGTLDLAVANGLSNTISVLLGNVGGTFQAAVNYPTGAYPWAVAVGDLNGDGNADLVVTSPVDNEVSIFFGEGASGFHAGVTYPLDEIPEGVAVGSFNGDGRADLVTADAGDADVSLLLNLAPAPELQVTLINSGYFVRGVVAVEGGPIYTITVTNVGAAPTSGTVTVTDMLPSGVTLTGISGTGWACVLATVTCTRSDPLAPLAIYNPITLTMNILAGAAAGINDTVSVTGGGQVNPANNTAQDFASTLSIADSTTAWATVPLPSGLARTAAPLLLTDGSVMVQQYCTGNWFKLTPDTSGSYATGTWSQLASMPAGYGPYAYASAVLADGRVVVIGGEYNLNCGGGDMVETALGAIYDPIANVWTSLPAPPGWTTIGDAASVILPGGQFLLASITTTGIASLDPGSLTWTLLNSSGKADTNTEEGWTLLPDGSVLTIDISAPPGSERYLPQSETWVSAGNVPGPLSAQTEIGPQVLRPDGTVFAVGASGHTGIYNSVTGSWAAGPNIPIQNGVQLEDQDSPAVLLPSGHVLVSQGEGLFFEFDGTQLNLVPPPPTAGVCVGMLPLPNGQILCSGNAVSLYTPSGTPNPAWAPAISNAPASILPGQTYSISGTQFNGLSQAVGYGDDYQAATNYPLVRIMNTATGHVYYARTHGHSSMGVATGSLVASTNFDVPASVELGPATVVVVANGIASSPWVLNVGSGPAQYQLTISASPSAGGTVTPPSGGLYNSGTVVPITATANSGYTFSSWTGNVANANNASTTVAMSGAQTVVANFTPVAPLPAAFFTGQVSLGGGVEYLQFPNQTVFGYYNFLSSAILYHYDMGFEAFVPGSASDLFLYDFTSAHWWYTSSALFPYLYDFTLKAWLYYFPNTQSPGRYTTNPRYFSNLTTGQIFTM